MINHMPGDGTSRIPDASSVPQEESLLACLLTPSGRGAVATVAVRGDCSRLDRCFRAASGDPFKQMEAGRIYFGHWGSAPASEDVVVVRTEVEAAEIHCHGGTAAVARILRDLTEVGAIVLSPQAWLTTSDSTPSAQFLTECQWVLTQAATQRTAHHLLRQCTLLPQEIDAIDRLPDTAKSARIARLLRWSHFGVHLTRPWKIVLCGRPNVGKSSLINALLGYQRSIVYDQPGTTRDIVAVDAAFDGWPVELSDTAGIRELDQSRSAADQLESAGIARTYLHLQEADVVVLVFDAEAGILPEDHRLLEVFPQGLIVLNKADLIAEERSFGEFTGSVIRCSARNGTGLTELISALVSRIVPEEPDSHTPFPVTKRQVEWLTKWQDELSHRQCQVE